MLGTQGSGGQKGTPSLHWSEEDSLRPPEPSFNIKFDFMEVLNFLIETFRLGKFCKCFFNTELYCKNNTRAEKVIFMFYKCVGFRTFCYQDYLSQVFLCLYIFPNNHSPTNCLKYETIEFDSWQTKKEQYNSEYHHSGFCKCGP